MLEMLELAHFFASFSRFNKNCGRFQKGSKIQNHFKILNETMPERFASNFIACHFSYSNSEWRRVQQAKQEEKKENCKAGANKKRLGLVGRIGGVGVVWVG